MDFRRAFDELVAERDGLLRQAHLRAEAIAIATAITRSFERGGRIYWFGNGGSAADAQHLAAEFSGRYRRERPSLPSEALSTNSSAVTAIGNDYGYDFVFARQLEGSARPGDVAVGLTTSGNSKNVVLGLEAARARGAVTIAFTGNGGGGAARAADLVLLGPDGYAALIQEVHITMGHIVCDLVEQALFPGAVTP
ncbi:MAG TPA: SIS domain-containing protein [Candidatus Elarobacter sp.]